MQVYFLSSRIVSAVPESSFVLQPLLKSPPASKRPVAMIVQSFFIRFFLLPEDLPSTPETIITGAARNVKPLSPCEGHPRASLR